MTTDEFAGKLLAVLHGPKAHEISLRLLDLMLDRMLTPELFDQGIADKLTRAAETFDQPEAVAPEHEALITLMLLAHVQDRIANALSADETMREVAARRRLLGILRGIIVKMSPESAGKLGI